MNLRLKRHFENKVKVLKKREIFQTLQKRESEKDEVFSRKFWSKVFEA